MSGLSDLRDLKVAVCLRLFLHRLFLHHLLHRLFLGDSFLTSQTPLRLPKCRAGYKTTWRRFECTTHETISRTSQKAPTVCFTPLLHNRVCLMSLLAGVSAQGEHHIFITQIVIHQHKDHALSKNHRKSKRPNDSGKSGNTHLLAFCCTRRRIETGT